MPRITSLTHSIWVGQCKILMLRAPAKYKNSAAFYDVDGTLIKIDIVTPSRSMHRARLARREHPPDDQNSAVDPGLLGGRQAVAKCSTRSLSLLRGASETVSSCSPRSCSRTSSSRTSSRARRHLIDEAGGQGAARCCSGRARLHDAAAGALSRRRRSDREHLEFENGYATGQLEEPFVAGATKAQMMLAIRREDDIDLGESWAYSDSFSDYPMLAVVGHPTACNPDSASARSPAVRLARARPR